MGNKIRRKLDYQRHRGSVWPAGERLHTISQLMLHIIAAFFGGDLHLRVYQQQLFTMLAEELLKRQADRLFMRGGDDPYQLRADGGRGKFSVSSPRRAPP